jgi:hypothetical protein
MLKIITAFAAVGCLTLASTVALADPLSPNTPVVGSQALPAGNLSPEHIGKIREEIRLHEARAHELEPIIARDRQARHDVEVDWAVLERHAREMHGKANDFRNIGNILQGPGQQELNGFATELDTFATHDEESAHAQHEIAERLDRIIGNLTAAKDWHLKMAQRLRDFLSRHGA